MQITRETLSNAAEQTADRTLRAGAWELWPKYKIRIKKNGERCITTGEPELPPSPDLEKTGGWLAPGSPELEQFKWRLIAGKERWPYEPLNEKPDLFLEFARWAESRGLDREPLDTDRNADAAVEWAETHGVLGLTIVKRGGHLGASTRGGPADTVESFAREAWIAHDRLRLYEAAIAPGCPDMDTLRSYDLSPHGFFTQTPEMARERALMAVAGVVQEKVARNAYPALYGEPGGFVQGWDFTNLLGAMWLQMLWLLTAQRRLCRNCRRIIPNPRKNKFYCDDTCKNAYNYRTGTKPRREAARH